MRLEKIFIIFRKELKDTLRDRRTMIFMLLVPIVAIPALMLFMSNIMISTVSKIQEEKAHVVVEGMQYLPADLRDSLLSAGRLKIDSTTSFVEKNLLDSLRSGQFDALVVIPENFDRAIEIESPTEIEIYYDRAEMKSDFALDKIRDILTPYKQNLVESRLASRDLPPEILTPFEVSRQNVASAKKVAGKEMGGMLPYLIIIMCFLGAMYPAIDLAAGEKERGTLETLLVSPATRGEFVIGKYLVILTTGVVAALLAMASLTYSINYFADSLMSEIGDIFALQFDIQTVVMILLMILPLAGLFASILLSLSIFARSFKEAQSYITALNMFIILPAFVSFLPGFELDYKLALVPVLNASLIMKDAIAGTIQWNLVIVAFVSTLCLCILSLYFCKHWFEREQVLFRT